MHKLIITFSFSLLLSLSILTPIVVSLIDINKEEIVLKDLCEKEDKSEKEIEEKELINSSYFNYESQAVQDQNTIYCYYIEGKSTFCSAILVPPPEHKA